MVVIDKELQNIYNEAMGIIETHKETLLKYNDTTSIKKAMYNIERVVVNRRVTSRRGCMKYVGPDTVSIEISGYMLKYPDKEVVTTMVHELLHCFRDSRGHKGNWKWRANILKESTGLNIVRCRSIEAEEPVIKTAKPVIKCRCKNCGYIIERTSNCKFTRHPERYTHRHCGGSFERISD